MALTTRGGNRLNPATVREIKSDIFDRDGWTCRHCGWRPPDEERSLQIGVSEAQKGARFLTIDHITPRSMGGSNQSENLQTLCNVCNRAKGSKLEMVQSWRGSCRLCGARMVLRKRKQPDEMDWYCC